jgi:hypothetical protein
MQMDIIHWGVSLGLCLSLAVITILCVVFYKWQPLNSRGALPLITSVSFFCSILMRSLYDQNVTIQSVIAGSCYFTVFKIQVGVIYLLSVFQYFRFLTMLQLFNRQVHLSTSISRDFQTKWYFRFLKNLRSPVVQIVVFLTLYAAYTILTILTYGFQSCDVAISGVVGSRGIIGYIITAVSYIAFLLVIIYDILLTWRQCFTCQVKQLWKQDGYWYRFEFYFLFMCVITPVYIATQIIEYSVRTRTWAFFGLLLGYQALIVFQQAVFPLILTIIAWLNQVCRKRTIAHGKFTDELSTILKNPIGHDLLLEFAKSEYSIENLLCFDDIERFKSIPSLDFAVKIHQKYLKGSSSEFEINIPIKEGLAIQGVIEREEIDVDMFRDVQRYVIQNISDTFSRFSFSSSYKTYHQQVQFFDEVMENDKK